MKKTFLAIMLLALIVALAFVKEYRDDLKEQEVYADGMAVGQAEADSIVEVSDSLEGSLETQKNRYEDSLSALSSYHHEVVDSLSQELDRAKKKVKAVSSRKKAAGAEEKKEVEIGPSGISKQLEMDVLTRYKERYRELPDDLTAYERRVALAEIREETVNEFNISLKTLAAVRSAHKLSY